MPTVRQLSISSPPGTTRNCQLRLAEETAASSVFHSSLILLHDRSLAPGNATSSTLRPESTLYDVQSAVTCTVHAYSMVVLVVASQSYRIFTLSLITQIPVLDNRGTERGRKSIQNNEEITLS